LKKKSEISLTPGELSLKKGERKHSNRTGSKNKCTGNGPERHLLTREQVSISLRERVKKKTWRWAKSGRGGPRRTRKNGDEKSVNKTSEVGSTSVMAAFGGALTFKSEKEEKAARLNRGEKTKKKTAVDEGV